MHRVQVTLVTGQVLTVTVDVPPGTPVQQVQIPGLPAPVQNIVDLGPIGTPTPMPVPTVPAVPDVDLPDVDLPDPRGSPGSRQGGGNDGGGGGGANTGSGSGYTQAAGAEESPVNRADSNVRSGAGRAKDKAKNDRPPAEPRRLPQRRRTRPSRSRRRGPARIGVPNFFIDKFRIPPFLLPIYQAAGIQYGVRWEILAAINEIETDYGRNLNVSSAGAARLDAVHAVDLAPVRRRRQRRQASRTRTTRSTRSSPPRATCAPPAPTRTSAAPCSPTTTPTGTSTPCSCARR